MKLTHTMTYKDVTFTKLANIEKKSKLVLENINKDVSDKKGVYLIVDDTTEEIYYIGITTNKKGFKARLASHIGDSNKRLLLENDPRMKTNYGKIKNLLEKCSVYVHAPEAVMYNGIEIDPTLGIEGSLIKEFQPICNTMGIAC